MNGGIITVKALYKAYLLLIVLASLALAGCLASTTPDPEKTVVMERGETVKFAVTTIGGPMVVNIWLPAEDITIGNFSSYAYTPQYIGEKTIRCYVEILYPNTNPKCNPWDPLCMFKGYYIDEPEWNIEVRGVQGEPNTNVAVNTGSSFELTVTDIFPEGEYVYQWYINDVLVNGATANSFLYTPVSGDQGVQRIEVKASNDAYTGSYIWDLYIPFSVIGGSGNDKVKSIQQTSDGGFIVAGYSDSVDLQDITNHGNNDYYIIKVAMDGIVEWQKLIGGVRSDSAASICQTTDGGYIIAGSSSSTDIPGIANHGERDCYIIKLDADGEIMWQKMFGGSSDDDANSVVQTSDGGYIIAGSSLSTEISGMLNHGRSDFYIIKLGTEGEIQWQKLIGGSSMDSANAIQQTSDGGYIVAGWSNSTDVSTFSNKEPSILKLGIQGEIQWQNEFGENWFDMANSIYQTADGGYIAAGNSTHSTLFTSQIDEGRIIKFYANGIKKWEKTYQENKKDIWINSMVPSQDGGYIVTGYTDLAGVGGGGYKDTYIFKINDSGTIQWKKTYWTTGDDWAESIAQTSDGNYIVAGFMRNDVYLLRINEDGEME